MQYCREKLQDLFNTNQTFLRCTVLKSERKGVSIISPVVSASRRNVFYNKNSFQNLGGLCKFFPLGSLVGGFLDFNCEDDILKKSAEKIIKAAKVIVIIKLSILRFYYSFHR